MLGNHVGNRPFTKFSGPAVDAKRTALSRMASADSPGGCHALAIIRYRRPLDELVTMTRTELSAATEGAACWWRPPARIALRRRCCCGCRITVELSRCRRDGDPTGAPASSESSCCPGVCEPAATISTGRRASASAPGPAPRRASRGSTLVWSRWPERELLENRSADELAQNGIVGHQVGWSGTEPLQK